MIRRDKPNTLKKKSRKGQKANGLEKRFMLILKLLNLELDIDYRFQYDFEGKLFDFYLIKSQVLIEVDGDFFHCNENKHELKYDIQRNTIQNDIKKNKLCLDNKQKLLRFWEQDIIERPELVITRLRKAMENG